MSGEKMGLHIELDLMRQCRRHYDSRKDAMVPLGHAMVPRLELLSSIDERIAELQERVNQAARV